MATKDFNELENKVYGSSNSAQTTQSKTVQNSKTTTHLLDERTDFKQIGFQDGIFMSADYQEGFVNGLSCGIKEARERTLRALETNLKANRERKIEIDYNFNPDHFLLSEVPGLAIFALPPSNKGA